jgi:hypothetical protein
MNREYPYLVARDKHVKWEYYLTIKPNRRIYLQGISKAKIAKLRKKHVEKKYTKEVSKLENGNLYKPVIAKKFYNDVFGDRVIATHI